MTTGTSSRIFLPSVLRPMRCCSRANGCTALSFQTTISPSTTVPSGRLWARLCSSETLGDQFFPSRPDPQAVLALDQLCAYAVPLPLHLPVIHRPQRGFKLIHRLLQSVG